MSMLLKSFLRANALIEVSILSIAFRAAFKNLRSFCSSDTFKQKNIIRDCSSKLALSILGVFIKSIVLLDNSTLNLFSKKSVLLNLDLNY